MVARGGHAPLFRASLTRIMPTLLLGILTAETGYALDQRVGSVRLYRDDNAAARQVANGHIIEPYMCVVRFRNSPRMMIQTVERETVIDPRVGTDPGNLAAHAAISVVGISFSRLPASAGMLRQCTQCASFLPREIVKRCSRCQTACYCSTACQTANWPLHRNDCHS